MTICKELCSFTKDLFSAQVSPPLTGEYHVLSLKLFFVCLKEKWTPNLLSGRHVVQLCEFELLIATLDLIHQYLVTSSCFILRCSSIDDKWSGKLAEIVSIEAFYRAGGSSEAEFQTLLL